MDGARSIWVRNGVGTTVPARAVTGAGDPGPAWPQLRIGFLARGGTAPGSRLLGIEAAPGHRGGRVFDASGHLAGMALPAPDGRDRLWRFGPGWETPDLPLARPPEASAPQPQVGAGEIDELGLRLALQVLAVR